jgi:AGZA family xanthine/uracil permease-like MFS transporter
MLESLFKLSANGTNVRTEILAGITTFLTMAYILFVNPSILSAAGMDHGAVFVATCLAAAAGTLIMGLYANYPVALAPGMGLNAYFTYGVVQGMGHGWPVALGAVFVAGILFLILSLLPVREWIINAIPRSLKLAISAGIGLFLAIIGLQKAGIVVDHPVTLVTLGDMSKPEVLLAAAGFVLMVVLGARRVPGAMINAILAVTAVSLALGISDFGGVFSLPPSLAPTFMRMDVASALESGLVAVILAFLIIDLFDTAGTLIGLAQRSGLLDAQGRLPRFWPIAAPPSSAPLWGPRRRPATSKAPPASTPAAAPG